MAYVEKFADVSGSAAVENDRRQAEEKMLIGEYPTDAELSQSIEQTKTGEEVGFFSSRGVRFAAAWWLNHFAESFGGDISKVPDEDVIDRVKGVLKKMNRDEDARMITDEVRKARVWYANRQNAL